MMKMTKMLLIVSVLTSAAFSALADRGIGKKNKNKVEFNITTSSNLKSSIGFNLRSGLKYTGSLLVKQEATSGRTPFNNTLVTYQKGNTVYIIPHKQSIQIADLKQGYTGVKLIIQPR